MPYQALRDSKTITVDIQKRRPMLRVAIDEAIHTVSEVRCPAAGDFEITIDGQLYHGWRYATADEVYIRIAGRTHVIGLPQFGSGGAAAGHTEDEVRADMPGTVVSVHCAAGEDVTLGQKLVTIESMKLQISMVAPRDGKIAAVNAVPNTTFERGVVLVALEPIKE
jgi:acetyl/propionyl-CoA carboxylase alpha subunit